MSGRRVPVGAVLAYAVTALTLVLAALLAARVGPLVATPRPVEPSPAHPVDLPPPQHLPDAAPAAAPSEMLDLTWVWWVAAVLGVLILIAIVRWLLTGLLRPARIAAVRTGQSPTVITPAEVGLAAGTAEVDLLDGRTFDATRAADDIIASWSAVERAAELLGATRRRSSTPTEFLNEACETWGDPPTAGPAARSTLLQCYHRARFDTALLAPGAATRARAAARELIIGWQRSATAGEAGTPPVVSPAQGASNQEGDHR